MRKTLFGISVIVALALVTPVYAGAAFYEGFSYGTGNLQDVSGWTHMYNGSMQVNPTVSLGYPDLVSTTGGHVYIGDARSDNKWTDAGDMAAINALFEGAEYPTTR